MKLNKTEKELMERMQDSPNRWTCIEWGTYYGPGKPRHFGRRECHAGQSLINKGLAKFVRHEKSQHYKNGYSTHIWDTIIELA